MNLIKESDKEYTHLSDFLKMVFILSHGNATFERGFSVKSDCMIENQNQESIIALRIVYDAVKTAGGIQSITIDKKMNYAARNAYSMLTTDSKKKQNVADAEKN